MTHNQDGPAVPERIVRAAIALFSRQGYYRTGTREIARLADVSEVTLFRYFEHKEDVFSSALNASFQSVESRLNLFGRGAESRSPEEMLPKILGLLVDITIYSPELPKLVAVAALELRGKWQDRCYRRLAPLLTAIASYLRANIQIGRLRDLNPAIVTAAMALTVIAHPELSNLIEGSTLSQMGSREALEEYTSFWLKVLTPSEYDRIHAPEVQLLQRARD